MNRLVSRFGSVLIFVLLSSVATAQVKLDDFAAKTFKSPKGGQLLYRQLDVKDAKADQKYPLVLFLHGAGGRGDDNQRQLKDAGVLGLFSKSGFPRKFPAFVLAPQVPAKKRWVEVHWGLDEHTMPTKPGDQMRMALELVDQFIKDNPVDTSRIYVTGLSMGGFGTWDAIQRRPGFFAAAAPVCGGGDTATASTLTKVPLWVFHGGKDKVVKTKRSQDMVAAIKAAGGSPKYTEYPGVGHGCWGAAYGKPAIWEWMFAQKRTDVVAAAPTSKAMVVIGTVRVACVGDSITYGARIKDRENKSYPAQLGKLLGSGWDVRNYGVSARTMLKKGDNPIWKEKAFKNAIAFNPHVVIIKLGTNDTKPQNWKHKGEFAADTAAMVKGFQALEARPIVYLCRPVPAFPANWGITDAVIKGEVIPLIDQAAAATGAKIIDLYKLLEGKKQYFPDKIHPNAAGAGIMAAEIAGHLKKDVQKK
jgi:dienelactone hydrolase/lysophospholipase L1-like esterase